MKKQYIIEVSTKSNPSLVVRSRTNNVKQRKERLRQNILASRGQAPKSLKFDRFDPFNAHNLSDITYDIYGCFTKSENLF